MRIQASNICRWLVSSLLLSLMIGGGAASVWSQPSLQDYSLQRAPVSSPSVEQRQTGTSQPAQFPEDTQSDNWQADNQPQPAEVEQRMSRFVPTSAERLVIQSMMRLLIRGGMWPEEVLTAFEQGKNPTVTRAAFADILVKSLGYPPDMPYSEFPSYRDVPGDHWAYRPIEITRERRLMTHTPNGFFRPEETMTNLEAYVTFAHTLAGKNPSLELAETILEPFTDVADVPTEYRPVVARLVNARILVPGRSQRLAPNAPLRYARLAGMLSREVEITNYKRFVLPVVQEVLPLIPPGVPLSVVPTAAMFKSRLVVGDRLYFTLTQSVPVDIAGRRIELSMGSRIEGEVSSILDRSVYQVSFNRLEIPEGDLYQIRGSLLLTFDPNDPEAFIVPGAPYQVFTTP